MPEDISDTSPLQYLAQMSHVPLIRPYIEHLDTLRFRLAPHTREAVLKLAGEQI